MTTDEQLNTAMEKAYAQEIKATCLVCGNSVAVDASALAAAKAEGRAEITSAVLALADDLAAGTARFMADYDAAGGGFGRRMSGESAALLVEARCGIESRLRDVLATHAERGQ